MASQSGVAPACGSSPMTIGHVAELGAGGGGFPRVVIPNPSPELFCDYI